MHQTNEWLDAVCLRLAGNVIAATKSAPPEIRAHFATPSACDRLISQRLLAVFAGSALCSTDELPKR